jgi:hypothetical protein
MYTAYEHAGIDVIPLTLTCFIISYRTISSDLRPLSQNIRGALKQGLLVSRMVPLSAGRLLFWIIVVND